MSLVQSPFVDCVLQRSGSTMTTTTTANTTIALEFIPLFEEEEEQPAVVTIVDQPRLSLKCKLDDYGGPTYDDCDDEDNDVFAELVSIRMRKDEPNTVNSSFDSHPHPTATTATVTATTMRPLWNLVLGFLMLNWPPTWLSQLSPRHLVCNSSFE